MNALDDLLKQLDLAIDSADRVRACQILGDVVAMTGDRPDVLSAYGKLLFETGQFAAAENAIWRSLALDPNHGDSLQLLGRLRLRAGHLQLLPGSRYAQVALPLDYPPSRQLRPRWGQNRPTHAGLAALFARNQDHYREVIAELRTLVPFFSRIAPTFSAETAPVAGWVGAPVNAIDLALLYYFVWKHRPANYLEIGSGATTCFARRAVADHGLATRIMSIDPEPRSSIDGICDQIIREGLETLPDLQVFADLQPGDIVFLDGSHRCFMNSDVTVFFLDVLPLLKPGVIVHIHDIALPGDYPDMFTHWYWNEQYILAAYLLGMGNRVRVLLPSAYLSTTPGLMDCLQPPLLAGVGDPAGWLLGGSFWFTHL